jgi:hypothetical protein
LRPLLCQRLSRSDAVESLNLNFAGLTHSFSKDSVPVINLEAGRGVAGDAHAGVTVKHRSRVAKDPAQPNLRQVHLLHSELFAELVDQGLHVAPGQMGENITTAGLALLELSEGAILRIGERARVRVTGLRNPCAQVEAFLPGLLAAVLDRTPEGVLVRKAGIMGVVLESGPICPGDAISVESSPESFIRLRPV